MSPSPDNNYPYRLADSIEAELVRSWGYEVVKRDEYFFCSREAGNMLGTFVACEGGRSNWSMRKLLRWFEQKGVRRISRGEE